VLNSLNGEFIDKGFDVLAKGGRFVEIGKLGIWDEQKVQTLRPDVHYFPFDLGEIEASLISSMLEEVMAMFREGSLKALPLKVFPITNVVGAFRYMQQAKHIGKVVLKFQQRKEDIVRQEGSYLVTGGLGALGLKVAHWLIKEGAQHLVLTGRSGANQAAKKVINQLEQAGAKISLIRADVANREEVKKLLAECPNLRGIVHAAGVLDDGILMAQTLERFEKVMRPKIKGAWNLHTLTQDLPLDFFVLFSSAASLIGSAGQANYAAANAFMDALAHYRQALGVPALSINWGPWAKSGMAASLEKRLNAQGMKMIAPEQGLQVLGELLKEPSFQVGVLPMEWAQYQRQYSSGGEPPLLSSVLEQAQSRHSESIKFLESFNSASKQERTNLLVGYIQKQVAQVLGLARSQLDIQQPLNYMGLDSLMAVELRNRMKSELGVELSVATFLEGLSVSTLATQVMEQMGEWRKTSGRQELSPTREKKRIKVVL
jgi:myxalamid-type polyketide synthase MxaB